MNTINLPKGLILDDLFLALIAAANYAENNNMDALAQERRKQAMALQDANDKETIDLTEVGAVCHCDQRDADEIAVYFKADELVATLWAIGRITFGDLTDEIDVRHVHGAYTEIEAVALDRLS